MATSVLPFRGSTTAVVFHEILSGTPANPLHLNPDLPADLQRLIGKALEKVGRTAVSFTARALAPDAGAAESRRSSS
jgi:hypothetical protein